MRWAKFETRSSKSETNSKFEIRTSIFEFASSFEFRVSSLDRIIGFPRLKCSPAHSFLIAKRPARRFQTVPGRENCCRRQVECGREPHRANSYRPGWYP